MTLNEYLKDKAAKTGDILYFTRSRHAKTESCIYPETGFIIDRTDGYYHLIRAGQSFYEDTRDIIPLALFRPQIDLQVNDLMAWDDCLSIPIKLQCSEAERLLDAINPKIRRVK